MRLVYLFAILTSFIALAAISCTPSFDKKSKESYKVESINKTTSNKDSLPKIVKTEEEWRAQLTSFEYDVLRRKGTERPWTGSLLKNKEEGIYTCKACSLPLFKSNNKFESGTGWPSFWQPINSTNVGEIADYEYGMVRTEVVCARCNGHLGHVFDDGPAPTGLRYCINSVSLNFEKSIKE